MIVLSALLIVAALSMAGTASAADVQVMISAGFDAHWDDPLTSLGLSTRGYFNMSKKLVELAEEYCDGKIVFGLAAIKGCGRICTDAVVRARNEKGPFRDLFDFCRRLDSRLINRRALESLVKAGAFDSLGLPRAHLMTNADGALETGQRQQRRLPRTARPLQDRDPVRLHRKRDPAHGDKFARFAQIESLAHVQQLDHTYDLITESGSTMAARHEGTMVATV